MTDILLIIIAVLLAVRIVMQVRQGKRAFEKMYQATSEVENCMERCEDDIEKNKTILKEKGDCGYEFVQAIASGGYAFLFFTRKKIKNFLEE